MTIPTPPASPCTNLAAISSSTVGLIGAERGRGDVRDDADQQYPSPPVPV